MIEAGHLASRMRTVQWRPASNRRAGGAALPGDHGPAYALTGSGNWEVRGVRLRDFGRLGFA